MKNQTMKNSLKAAILLVFAMAGSSFAELAGMNDNDTAEKSESTAMSALVGLGGGNSLIADDGVIFMTMRIGVDVMQLFSTGAWFTTTIEDVRNHNVDHKQMVNYNAFGAFVELFPLRFDKFAISVPIKIGGGAVNAMDKGDEAFESEEYFFTADMAAHFNYRLTKMLEVSVGGGYRMFAGIDKNNLDNMDFNTPFGELRFTIKE
jgi:hypothetical protein